MLVAADVGRASPKHCLSTCSQHHKHDRETTQTHADVAKREPGSAPNNHEGTSNVEGIDRALLRKISILKCTERSMDSSRASFVGAGEGERLNSISGDGFSL